MKVNQWLKRAGAVLLSVAMLTTMLVTGIAPVAAEVSAVCSPASIEVGSTTEVSVALSGLTAGTWYRVRIYGAKADGTADFGTSFVETSNGGITVDANGAGTKVLPSAQTAALAVGKYAVCFMDTSWNTQAQAPLEVVAAGAATTTEAATTTTTTALAGETIAIDSSIIADSNTGDGSSASNPIIIKENTSSIPFVLYTTTDRDWVALYGEGIDTLTYYSSYFYLTDSTVSFPARGSNNGNAATITWPLPAGTSYIIRLMENDTYTVNQTIYIQVEDTATTTTTEATTTTTEVVTTTTVATTTTAAPTTTTTAAPAFSLVGDKAEVYPGDTIALTITGMDVALNLAAFKANASNQIANYSDRFGYVGSIPAGTTSYNFTIPEGTAAGTYVLGMWNGNWAFKDSKFVFTVLAAPTTTTEATTTTTEVVTTTTEAPTTTAAATTTTTAAPAPVITPSATTITAGETINFTIENAEGLTFGILPGNANGNISAYTVKYGYKGSCAASDSASVTITEAGYYVAAVWGSGWSFKAQVPLVVEAAPTTTTEATTTTTEVVTTTTAAGETIAIDSSIIAASNTGDGSSASNPIIIKEGTSNIPFVLYTTTDRDWVALYGEGIDTLTYYSSYFYLTDSTVSFPARGASNPNAATITWPLPAGTSYVIRLMENDTYTVNQTIYIKVEGTATTTTGGATTTTTVSSTDPSLTADKTVIAVGEAVTITIKNAPAGAEFGVVYDNGSGQPSNTNPPLFTSYYKLSSGGNATRSITFTAAGNYVASLWTSGWNHVVYVPITVDAGATTTTAAPGSGPSIVADKTTLTVGDTINFTITNAAGLTFGVLPGRANGQIDAYSPILAYKASCSDSDSANTIISTPGYYVAAVWGSGWSFKTQVPFEVVAATTTAPTGPYVNYGDRIVVLEDGASIDLSTEPHNEVDGKLFIGWVDAQGNPAANSATYDADVVLTAKYVDMSKETGGDLYINGVQMRTEGVQGLRFIIGRSDALNLTLANNSITVLEEGALALPSELLGLDTLTHDTEQVAAVKAINTFPEYETGASARRLFTVVLTNLTGKYARVYTVRGYVKFTDLNGNVAYAYSNEYATSLYGVATTTLAEQGSTLDSTVVAELEEVINTVKEAALAKYNALPKNAPVYADSGKYSNVLVNTSAIEALKDTAFDGFDMYHLGEAGSLNGDTATEGGLIVTDITIDAGLGDDAVTIVQLSDLHFNYLNAQDEAEANPTLLSTYANRSFGKNNVPNVQKAADFAYIADQVIVTGDGIDYLSHGTIELLYKEIWNKFPNALVTGGNHEYAQQMQGSVPETLTMTERMDWVTSEWKHDYEYASQMVGEKVMAISMDNGRRGSDGYYSFAEGTAAKLEADLATAKANGYTVLIFCHVGLYTNNPDETDVKSLFVNDTYNRFDTATRNIINWCDNTTGDFCGYDGMDATSETAKVYDLLTHNADVVKGVFNGHMHGAYYTEIVAETSTGEDAVIPQYTMTGSGYYHGHATKITVQ